MILSAVLRLFNSYELSIAIDPLIGNFLAGLLYFFHAESNNAKKTPSRFTLTSAVDYGLFPQNELRRIIAFNMIFIRLCSFARVG